MCALLTTAFCGIVFRVFVFFLSWYLKNSWNLAGRDVSCYEISATRRLTGSSRFQISESGELNNSLSALFQQVFISGWWRAPLSPPTPPLIHPVKWYHAGYSWSSCPSFAALPTPPHRDRQAACAKPIPPPPPPGRRAEDAAVPRRWRAAAGPPPRLQRSTEEEGAEEEEEEEDTMRFPTGPSLLAPGCEWTGGVVVVDEGRTDGG